MELQQYIRLVRRWLWLLLLAGFIGGSISFISQATRTPFYQAQTTIAIGGFIESPNPNTQDIYTGRELAQTYIQIINTFDVLNGTAEALNLPFDAALLRGMVSSRIIEGTSLLQITTRYTDPVLATDITNEIAHQLIIQSPTNLTEAQQQQIDLLNDQIESQTEELRILRNQLNEVDANLEEAETEDRRLSLLEQRNTLVNQINEASFNIAQFTNTIAEFQQRTNSVEIVEHARIPSAPIGTGGFSNIILGVMVGGALAFGGVLTYEYLNDTLRTTYEVTHALDVPIVGVISRFGKPNDSYSKRIITNLAPFSQVAEEYRMLRTNLMYSADHQNRAIIVSSASPEEGKTITAVNLAVSMALSGQRVLLIDADLRRPKVHQALGIPNDIGLTSILTRQDKASENGMEGDTAPMSPIDRVLTSDSWKKVMQKTNVPNLLVIASGTIPKNPSELLGSTLMKRWMKQFRSSPHIDVIIFDTPPVLAVSDSAVLAAALDAQIVLVIRAASTRRTSAINAKQRFETVGVDVIGAVLNNANLRDEDYYGYNYGYYYTNVEPEPPKQLHG